ncbi:hypothetical protein [Algoriphagus confluentis]|uniref:Uncharacterized protein n=1 Tax=Algoriphagus confluentis TaxID=1697556 RepID=A0ABQ6PS07_9BACT|nr:hypothetical protein Aconfl_34130 [Algoriphagus confluentis]
MYDSFRMMSMTKYGPDYFKLGIRALALFQLYLAYLLGVGAGFGFETLGFTLKYAGALMLIFLSYLFWIASYRSDQYFRIRIALGLVSVGLLLLLPDLPELIMGSWTLSDWIFLGYFLIGSGAILELYRKENLKKK